MKKLTQINTRKNQISERYRKLANNANKAYQKNIVTLPEMAEKLTALSKQYKAEIAKLNQIIDTLDPYCIEIECPNVGNENECEHCYYRLGELD